MTVGFVAFHYPRPEYFEEFVSRTHGIREFMQAQPGFLSGGPWATVDGDAVVTIGQFESTEAFQAAFAPAAELGDIAGFDEREHRPRQIHTLLSR
ncbi:hypothetical protein ACIQ9Q_40525 [Streptomyces sp. NPDC094438]|uniref:hypothetical protein n=1 Tax=Streptomyces sp. NPDC094438 TaxID=3366061 RepID=UPI003827D6AA